MGQMIDGRWHAGEATEASKGGDFKRQDSGFRDWITADGAPGPEGRPAVRAEADRFHLYISHACPWAHRTLIVRALKHLEPLLPVSVVHPLMRDDGWTFQTDDESTGDLENGFDFLWQVYARARPDYSGKVTVPVLWDRKDGRIVNNESSEILRILNRAFDGLGATDLDLYPLMLRVEIDRVNARVYDAVNNGVYKAGFATTQQAYEAAVFPLFEALDGLETQLTPADWLVGDRMTEADIRLFTTLIRFDAVYATHFKCNLRRIADYPALSRFLKRMMDIPAIAGTVHFGPIKTHYYASHRDLNPSGIVPAGPIPPWGRPDA
ncbi:glutathione-dependent reductase [Brevundimonas sp. LM2]|uniref:glutathione S-transferase family protein n=1 Tax=Brevundimonas sp. LM2 TaxID=1938605 RepID=UPI000983D2EA|nr:glutathione S-transferase family protein [Brevundimonas sp. LM2]AQR62537.1 glutathione-dependent reductase [Brevundimonas sp. LM2]